MEENIYLLVPVMPVSMRFIQNGKMTAHYSIYYEWGKTHTGTEHHCKNMNMFNALYL